LQLTKKNKRNQTHRKNKEKTRTYKKTSKKRQ